MAEKCSGECIKCSMQQQLYCSAYMSHAIMENQRVIVERLDLTDKAVSSLTERSDIINPFEEKKAQKSAGADNRAEETK